MVYLESWENLEQGTCAFYRKKNRFENLTFFTLPWPDLRQKLGWMASQGQMAVTIDVYVQNHPENTYVSKGMFVILF